MGYGVTPALVRDRASTLHAVAALQCQEMATRNPLARGKRERERARAEKQKEKAVKRSEARARRGAGAPDAGGTDPDIADIVPGPQANPWGDERGPDDEAGEEAEPEK